MRFLCVLVASIFFGCTRDPGSSPNNIPHDGASDAHASDARRGPADVGTPAPLGDGGATTSDDATVSLGAGFVELSSFYDAGAAFNVLTGREFGEPETSYGVFGDLDGDGRPDLYLAPEFLDRGPRDRRAIALRYDVATASFSRLSPFDGRMSVRAITDLDGDGNVDLIGNLDRPAIAWGLGPGRFAEPALLESANGQPSLDTFANVTLADLDADGWLDLVVSAATCCATCKLVAPYVATGLRRYDLQWSAIPDGPQAKPYTSGVAGVFDGSPLLLALGGGCEVETRSPVMFRRASSTGPLRFEGFEPTPREFVIGGTAPFLSKLIPMGATMGDLDGDGVLDLLVSLDSVLAVFELTPTVPWVDRSLDTTIAHHYDREGHELLPWAMALLDVDRDGRADVVTSHGNDLGRWLNPAMAGIQQRVTVDRNRALWRFEDVTAASGLGRLGQWRSLTVGDLDLDGDPDLVVGGDAEVPRVYRNDGPADRYSLGLRLHGTTSNAPGIGARVEVTVAEGSAVQAYVAGHMLSPGGWNEPLVFAGTGTARSAARVTITWPSGVVQELRDVATGALRDVTEPRLLAVEPAGRRIPADGVTTARVVVTPRARDGSVDASARLELSLVEDVRRTSLTLVAGENMWTADVPPRATPGSAVLELRVNGVVSGILPRLWWAAP